VGVPAIALYARANAQKTLETTVQSNGTGLTNDYIAWYVLETKTQSHTIANAVEAAGIDLRNASQVAANRSSLQSLLEPPATEASRPDSWKNFRLVTDANGKTVAQYLRIHEDYQPGTALEDSAQFIKNLSLPTGIDLSNIPIVKAALSQKRALEGVEVIDTKTLQKLGLGEQLKPEGQKQISKGLVVMAVEPIEVNGRVVGLSMTGTLFNRGHLLVDNFQDYYGSSAGLFAGDLQVATSVPSEDGKGRAIAEQAPKEVTDVVLGQGKDFLGRVELGGKTYLAYYHPLYDHQKILNPSAKPVGMVYAGNSQETVENALDRVLILGYSIGGGFLLLCGLLAIPLSSTFSRPLQQLQEAARKIARGEKVTGLAATDRQDEIGVLSQELDRMAARMESNLTVLRQETAREQLLKEITFQLSQYPQVENAFDKALDRLRLHLGADRAFFYRFDEETLAGTVVAESVAAVWPRALGAVVTDPCFNGRRISSGSLPIYR
jgi:methyl-accepting chemotaxis protein PixJ